MISRLEANKGYEGWEGIDPQDPSTWRKEVEIGDRKKSVAVFEAKRMELQSQVDQRLS